MSNPDDRRLSIDEILQTRPADFHQDDYDRSFVWMQNAIREARIILRRKEGLRKGDLAGGYDAAQKLLKQWSGNNG